MRSSWTGILVLFGLAVASLAGEALVSIRAAEPGLSTHSRSPRERGLALAQGGDSPTSAARLRPAPPTLVPVTQLPTAPSPATLPQATSRSTPPVIVRHQSPTAAYPGGSPLPGGTPSGTPLSSGTSSGRSPSSGTKVWWWPWGKRPAASPASAPAPIPVEGARSIVQQDGRLIVEEGGRPTVTYAPPQPLPLAAPPRTTPVPSLGVPPNRTVVSPAGIGTVPPGTVPPGTVPPSVARPVRPVYLGQGILGQPKVYVEGQPLRNALRFLTP